MDQNYMKLLGDLKLQPRERGAKYLPLCYPAIWILSLGITLNRNVINKTGGSFTVSRQLIINIHIYNCL